MFDCKSKNNETMHKQKMKISSYPPNQCSLAIPVLA